MQIITGMHRSGTSVVTRIFYEMGANLGSENTFYRPDIWNPEGYFEQPDIHRINMPLVNGIFWKFAYFHLPSTQTIRKRGQRMQNLIQNTIKKYDDKLVKETRFCLTMPAWLDAGANFDKVLICLRNPYEVAKSIHKRNHVGLSHGYYLFREHYQRILAYTKQAGSKNWFINYANLISADQEIAYKEISSALDFLEMQYSPKDLQECLKKVIRDPINKLGDENIVYPEDIRVLWNSLKNMHRQQF